MHVELPRELLEGSGEVHGWARKGVTTEKAGLAVRGGAGGGARE